MMPSLLVLVGLLALVGGAELVVRYGSLLATRLGISPMMVGLTVVSIGTNGPELAVGIAAAWHDNGALAVGNVAGTNVANVLLVLGLSALLAPMALGHRTLRVDLPVMVAASLALVVLGGNGILSRFEGLVLTLAAIAYTLVIIHIARRQNLEVKEAASGGYGAAMKTPSPGRISLDLAAVAFGIGIIVLGSDWLVEGAVGLSRILGVSEAFIGLTIVAIGTSMPELATAVVGTLRNERDIVIGNAIGSCVYNILLVLGASALIPPDGIELTAELSFVDIPVMAAVALVCVPVFVSGRRIGRREGAAFILAYIAYLTYLVLART